MKNKDLAKRVKALRKRKGFSQEKLTENSGLSLRTIQRIENGETEPTGDTLKRLSDALDVTPNELIDWTIKEDRGFLKALNLSALTFIFFPLLGILVPLIMWISKKDKLKDIDKVGKDLINFQITWTILSFTVPFIAVVIGLVNSMDSNDESIANTIVLNLKLGIILTIFLYLFNFTIIIMNAFRIHKEKDVIYYPKIKFLRKD
jgi:uncharacterized Tic20 family protein